MKVQTHNKHVLIVTYHMVPHTAQFGASQRMYVLAEQLIKEKYNVHVLHSSYGVNNNFGKNPSFNAKTILIKPNFIQKAQEQNQSNNSSKIKSSIKEKLLDGFIALTKNIFRGCHQTIERSFYNDWLHGVYAHLWCIQACPEADKIIKRNKTGHIIISGPYFTTFMIGKKIKKKYTNINLILDYRDPWNFLPAGSNIYTRYKERNYLNIADKISVFSEKFKSDIHKTYNISKDNIISVYNGYDETEWSETERKKNTTFPFPCSIKGNGKLVISYISSNITIGDGFRDVNNLLRALALADESERIALNLVGVSDKNEFDKFIGSNLAVNLINRVTHKNSLEILTHSDIVIILSTEKIPSLYTITGKLFDCIRSRAFILGVSNNLNIEYCKIIKKYDLGRTATNDITNLKNVFNKLFKLWASGNLKSSNMNNIPYFFSRAFQNKKLINYINSIQSKKCINNVFFPKK